MASDRRTGSWSSLVPLGISDFLLRGAGWGLESQGRAQTILFRVGRQPSHCLYLSTGVADHLGFPGGQMAGSLPVLSDWTEPNLDLLTSQAGSTQPHQREEPPIAQDSAAQCKDSPPTAQDSPAQYSEDAWTCKAHKNWPRLAECAPGAHPKCRGSGGGATQAGKRAACAHSGWVCAGDCWSTRLRSDAP